VAAVPDEAFWRWEGVKGGGTEGKELLLDEFRPWADWEFAISPPPPIPLPPFTALNHR
jgi:hypothetical protein